jgi:hypothetical protein
MIRSNKVEEWKPNHVVTCQGHMYRTIPPTPGIKYMHATCQLSLGFVVEATSGLLVMVIEWRRFKHIKEGLKRDKRESVRLPQGSGLCWLDVVRQRETRGREKGEYGRERR